MIIAIGSDHAGWEIDESKPDIPPHKPGLSKYLEDKGHTIVDCGTDGSAAVDYPEFAQRVCDAIIEKRADCGVIICGTGIGMAMTANRNCGIRAAACWSTEVAKLSREHNNANVLCLGRRVLTLEECFAIVDVWFDTPFSGAPRHCVRVEMMDTLNHARLAGESGA